MIHLMSNVLNKIKKKKVWGAETMYQGNCTLAKGK